MQWCARTLGLHSGNTAINAHTSLNVGAYLSSLRKAAASISGATLIDMAAASKRATGATSAQGTSNEAQNASLQESTLR